MNPANKTFRSMNGLITGREAMRLYPDPQFFMRPSPRLTLEECREYLHRNCNEAARVADMLRDVAGHKSKAPIINMANKLHDFRVSIDMHGGGMGQPYLWEE